MNYLRLYALAIGSLLSGAAVVHNIYKPDLVRHSSDSPSIWMYTGVMVLMVNCQPQRHMVCTYRSQC